MLARGCRLRTNGPLWVRATQQCRDGSRRPRDRAEPGVGPHCVTLQAAGELYPNWGVGPADFNSQWAGIERTDIVWIGDERDGSFAVAAFEYSGDCSTKFDCWNANVNDQVILALVAKEIDWPGAGVDRVSNLGCAATKQLPLASRPKRNCSNNATTLSLLPQPPLNKQLNKQLPPPPPPPRSDNSAVPNGTDHDGLRHDHTAAAQLSWSPSCTFRDPRE